ncbi:MAG: hypothetical protein WDN31_21395, partial [Hyphomicrobium sp.]
MPQGAGVKLVLRGKSRRCPYRFAQQERAIAAPLHDERNGRDGNGDRVDGVLIGAERASQNDLHHQGRRRDRYGGDLLRHQHPAHRTTHAPILRRREAGTGTEETQVELARH